MRANHSSTWAQYVVGSLLPLRSCLNMWLGHGPKPQLGAATYSRGESKCGGVRLNRLSGITQRAKERNSMMHPALVNHALTPTLTVSADWWRLVEAERRSRVAAALASSPDAAKVELRSVGRRDFMVLLLPGMRPAEYGAMLMRLEAHVRAALGEPLELYCDFAPDRNGLRRETQTRVAEWRQRRDMSRHANLEGV